jgi:hypothetical protein
VVDVMRDRRLGLAALAIGFAWIALAQWVAPVAGPPLYDGVIVVEPYRWLVPLPGQQGEPQSASATVPPDHGASPLVAVATPEQPPQAQIFGTSGALVLPPRTTVVNISIEPILPTTLPVDGHIDGNVYRIIVVNQAGAPLTAPTSARVSVVLRVPDAAVGAKIERFDGQAWRALKSDDAGFGTSYLAVVTEFGDFTIVAPGPGGPYPTATPAPGASGGSSPSPAGSATLAAPSSQVSPREAADASSGQPTPVAPTSDQGGGLPLAGVAALLIAAAILGVGAVLPARRRRRRARYRGAHPQRR